MISSLLHRIGLRPRDYYTLTNFRGGGGGPRPPPQYANGQIPHALYIWIYNYKTNKVPQIPLIPPYPLDLPSHAQILGQNPPRQNPPGQNPPIKPPYQTPPRTKPPWTKPPGQNPPQTNPPPPRQTNSNSILNYYYYRISLQTLQMMLSSVNDPIIL